MSYRKLTDSYGTNIYVWVGYDLPFPSTEDVLSAPLFTIFPGNESVRDLSLEAGQTWFPSYISDSERFLTMRDSGVLFALMDAGIIPEVDDGRLQAYVPELQGLAFEIQIDDEQRLTDPELEDVEDVEAVADAVRAGWTIIMVPDDLHQGGRTVRANLGVSGYVLDHHNRVDGRFTPSIFRRAADWLRAVDLYKRGDDAAIILSDYVLERGGPDMGLPPDWLAERNYELLDAYAQDVLDDVPRMKALAHRMSEDSR